MTKNQNYSVLSDSISPSVKCQSMAVFIHLYYGETLKNIYRYLNIIPDEVDIFVITPVDEIIDEIQKLYGVNGRITLIKKRNRGRDVAALLISCRDILVKYKYICFIHDKRAIKDNLSKDTVLWVRNIWDNLLASADFIKNVYLFFNNQKDCGLLIPPERHGDFFNDWIKSKWGRNYDTTRELANSLGLKVKVDLEQPSPSLGTAFWCRTEVLKKLIDHPWSYEDFQEEPMDDDGTISHAIERIFPYLAVDAGYSVRTIVSQGYCPTLLEYAQVTSRSFVSELERLIGVSRLSEIYNLEDVKKRIEKSISIGKKLYLFGAGVEGKYCLHYIRSLNVEPEAFLESCPHDKSYIEGIEIKSASKELKNNSDAFVIITPFHTETKTEIELFLKSLGVRDYIFWKNI